MDGYTDAKMTAGLNELLETDSAARIIDEAQGINNTIDESGWSELGCRELAIRAASSFLIPAQDCLEKIEALLV